MSDDDTIPKIGPELKPPIQLIVTNPSLACHHRSYVVDAKTREVTCSTCGALVDPFDALLQLSQERHNEVLSAQFRKGEIRELEQRKVLLTTITQRLKAEARRLGVPLALVNHWDTKKLSQMIGIDQATFERGRLIDAEWAKRRNPSKGLRQKPKLVKT